MGKYNDGFVLCWYAETGMNSLWSVWPDTDLDVLNNAGFLVCLYALTHIPMERPNVMQLLLVFLGDIWVNKTCMLVN